MRPFRLYCLAHPPVLLPLPLPQVYIGSFNSDAPINTAKNPHCVQLFEVEQAQLLHDLYEIPSRSCDRKARVCDTRVCVSAAAACLQRCSLQPVGGGGARSLRPHSLPPPRGINASVERVP